MASVAGEPVFASIDDGAVEPQAVIAVRKASTAKIFSKMASFQILGTHSVTEGGCASLIAAYHDLEKGCS